MDNLRPQDTLRPPKSDRRPNQTATHPGPTPTARTASSTPSPSPVTSSLPGLVRYVDRQIQTLSSGSSFPTLPVNHRTTSHPDFNSNPMPTQPTSSVEPLRISRSPTQSERRPSLLQSLMRVQVNEVHNCDAMLVDGFGGGYVARSSSVISPKDIGYPARDSSIISPKNTTGRADLEQGPAVATEQERRARVHFLSGSSGSLMRSSRQSLADAALERAFESWHRDLHAAAHPSPSTLDDGYSSDKSAYRSPSIAEKRQIARPAAVATRTRLPKPEFHIEEADADAGESSPRATTNPAANIRNSIALDCLSPPSAYSQPTSPENGRDSAPVASTQPRLPSGNRTSASATEHIITAAILPAQPAPTHQSVPPAVANPAAAATEVEYDLASLPREFLERIPPDISVAQAIHFAVQNNIVSPDFGTRAYYERHGGALSAAVAGVDGGAYAYTHAHAHADEAAFEDKDEYDEEQDYDLDNLPEAFVSRIPPGVTKVQAIQYAVRNGLVPSDFGKRSPDGRPLGPLGFVLPKGMTRDEVVALALQNGIHPPGFPINENVVTWSGPLSPSNPRNWSERKKWGATVAVSLSTFVSNMASSMVTPLIPLFRRQLQGLSQEEVDRNTIDFESSLVLSCYILAFAFAPFIYGPCSELFGRRRLLQGGIVLFFMMNLFCALASTLPTLIALRFFAALGAAAPMAVGGGVVTDIFSPQARKSPLLWFGLAPLLGPVLGPVLSGAISQAYDRWQPVFWASTVVIGLVGVLLMFLPESYVPKILEDKAERLRKETNNPDLVTIFDMQHETLGHRFGRYLVRPLMLLLTEPIMMLLALLTAVSFGQVYLLFAVLPSVHTKYYGESPTVGSLHFLSFGLGFVGGAVLGIGLIDRIHAALLRRYGGVPHPEFKLVLMMAVSPLAPVALVLFGWATEKRVHWIVGDLASFWFALCVSASFLSVQAYLVDTFALLAGSALTATIVTRSVLGFVFTLFTASLVQDIHFGHAFLLMGGISALVGLPVSIVLMRYGARLRQRSPYARG
ncbi:hypothetical protein OC842_004174 [Tilletia horrida]|uniref:Major facilitator superfamily (MFS) profile domain-containing protein n=1 Tax=Tilletia horrida TaxID=155126 RepID=A0AAN6G9U5_9BASI|nr:hypothetical protein OC842_004174 [Tilletia horrida]